MPRGRPESRRTRGCSGGRMNKPTPGRGWSSPQTRSSERMGGPWARGRRGDLLSTGARPEPRRGPEPVGSRIRGRRAEQNAARGAAGARGGGAASAITTRDIAEDSAMTSGTAISAQRTTPLDVAAVRQDFPILRQRVHGKPLVYLDNAATTQKPQGVIDRLVRYYTEDNGNVHRGVHWLR